LQWAKSSASAKQHGDDACAAAQRDLGWSPITKPREKHPMAWTTPILEEICIGLEINGYLPAEF
jgi:coenzyme PQQ precursor peptide PqqA